MREPLKTLRSVRRTQWAPEMLHFVASLLSEGRVREQAVRQWRQCAWFAGLDWGRAEAGRMDTQDGLLEHIDAFTSCLQPQPANAADIDAQTFISPARSAGLRGDTLHL